MTWTPTRDCFFCGIPITSDTPHVYADIRRHYKNGSTQEYRRNFHPECLEQFRRLERRLNSNAQYEVLGCEEMDQRTHETDS